MSTNTGDLCISPYWHNSLSQTDSVKPEHQKKENLMEGKLM